jgi:peptide-methionine (S)-S-oxide reductase
MRRATAWIVLFAVLAFAACRGQDAAPATAGPSAAPTAPAAPAAPPAEAAPSAPASAPSPATPAMPTPTPGPTLSTQQATFANGCFWCTEAVLEQLPGVLDVVSGYMGGDVDAPTYEQVCGGETGHAECVQVTFDPSKVTFESLLEWFFRSHDPTTLNRQGADVGTQYRSAVFFHSDEQKAQTLAAIKKYQPSFGSPIVTEVTAASRFWPAEPYHQDYFRRNPNQGYCRIVIAPKLKKLGLDDAK